MKIELDEKTIDNIVDYAINNPAKVRKLIKLLGEETLSVLKERKIIDEAVSNASKAAKTIIDLGVNEAMNRFNRLS